VEIEQRLERLGYVLDDYILPAGLALPGFVPATQVGTLLFLAGQVPFRKGGLAFTGLLGSDLSVAQGEHAARVCVLNALASLRAHLGDLDRITRVVRMVGYVASASGFAEQHLVLNGASHALMEFLGDKGRHPRMAIGVAALALGIPVELDLIVEVA
jgi:enamine deaminase RidA (YjgF/YER057c/UK114 family)